MGEGARVSHESLETPPVDEANTEELAPADLNAVIAEARPKTKRFDFGPGFFTRCSTCGKLSLNRGDKDTRMLYCLGCYRARADDLQSEVPEPAEQAADAPEAAGEIRASDESESSWGLKVDEKTTADEVPVEECKSVERANPMEPFTFAGTWITSAGAKEDVPTTAFEVTGATTCKCTRTLTGIVESNGKIHKIRWSDGDVWIKEEPSAEIDKPTDAQTPVDVHATGTTAEEPKLAEITSAEAGKSAEEEPAAKETEPAGEPTADGVESKQSGETLPAESATGETRDLEYAERDTALEVVPGKRGLNGLGIYRYFFPPRTTS